MNLSLYIAKRYIFSKKSHNVINIISGVSVCGVALATLALVCTLSVFNGFRDLVATLFTEFDPELKITSVTGKVFDVQNNSFEEIRNIPQIEVFTEVLEDNAMLQYKGKQVMITLKGVEDNFNELTNIEHILLGNGEFVLHDDLINYGVLGINLLSVVGCGIEFVDPIEVYAPRRGSKVNFSNPTANFNKEYLYSPGTVFMVNQEKYDNSYVITSIALARKLFNYDKEVSAIELKLSPDANVSTVQKQIQQLVGENYLVQNRYEQQDSVFRIMRIEKFISYLFLSFILLIACFNVIGSLSMLIIDKKKDVITLRNMGANNKLISRIFLFEGSIISLFGSCIGIVLGVILCLLQQEFGLIGFGESANNFIVSSYPVSVYLVDVLLVFVTVIVVGILSIWLPTKYLTKHIV